MDSDKNEGTPSPAALPLDGSCGAGSFRVGSDEWKRSMGQPIQAPHPSEKK
jgi:hypothetical protein